MRLLGTLCLLGWVLTPGGWELSCPAELFGYIGGSLSVSCCYKQGLEKYAKYWCKVNHILLCPELVNTPSGQKRTKDRLSIRDNQARQCVEVIMNNLTEADSGDYRCGINGGIFRDSTCTIRVAVSPAPTLAPEEWLRTSKSPASLLTTNQHRMSSSTQPPASYGFTEGTGESSTFSAPPGSPGFIFLLIAPGLKTLVFLCLVFGIIWMQRRRREPSRAGTQECA